MATFKASDAINLMHRSAGKIEELVDAYFTAIAETCRNSSRPKVHNFPLKTNKQ